VIVVETSIVLRNEDKIPNSRSGYERGVCITQFARHEVIGRLVFACSS
jgi:hypothetical protein